MSLHSGGKWGRGVPYPLSDCSVPVSLVSLVKSFLIEPQEYVIGIGYIFDIIATCYDNNIDKQIDK